MFIVQLAGNSFRPVEAHIAVVDLKKHEVLRLVREPTNQYDVNAIQVWTTREPPIFIGYIPRTHSELIAGEMDKGREWFAELEAPFGQKPYISVAEKE